MTLSIIIAHRNEPEELNATVNSIRATTSGRNLEIIVVDDCSGHTEMIEGIERHVLDPLVVEDQDVHVIRNTERMGCGGCRHIAAERATGSHIVFFDPHMRFLPGWYEAAMERMEGRPNTIHCGTCLGLNAANMDPAHPQGMYTGAKINFYGPDDNKPDQMQVLEGKWKDHTKVLPDKSVVPDDDCELPCLMGASYFMPRELFFRLGGLKALKQWGSDEPFLSLKAWLAGCDVRLMGNVQIGHKFRSEQPYSVNWWAIFYNKIRVMMTVMNQDEVAFLMSKMPQGPEFGKALSQIAMAAKEIQEEKAAFDKIRQHDIRWYCEKFGLKYFLE